LYLYQRHPEALRQPTIPQQLTLLHICKDAAVSDDGLRNDLAFAIQRIESLEREKESMHRRVVKLEADLDAAERALADISSYVAQRLR
jgi:hypothetical protein